MPTPPCFVCAVRVPEPIRCPECHIIPYCSVECQRADWTDGKHPSYCASVRDHLVHKHRLEHAVFRATPPSIQDAQALADHYKGDLATMWAHVDATMDAQQAAGRLPERMPQLMADYRTLLEAASADNWANGTAFETHLFHTTRHFLVQEMIDTLDPPPNDEFVDSPFLRTAVATFARSFEKHWQIEELSESAATDAPATATPRAKDKKHRAVPAVSLKPRSVVSSPFPDSEPLGVPRGRGGDVAGDDGYDPVERWLIEWLPLDMWNKANGNITRRIDNEPGWLFLKSFMEPFYGGGVSFLRVMLRNVIRYRHKDGTMPNITLRSVPPDRFPKERDAAIAENVARLMLVPEYRTIVLIATTIQNEYEEWIYYMMGAGFYTFLTQLPSTWGNWFAAETRTAADKRQTDQVAMVANYTVALRKFRVNANYMDTLVKTETQKRKATDLTWTDDRTFDLFTATNNTVYLEHRDARNEAGSEMENYKTRYQQAYGGNLDEFAKFVDATKNVEPTIETIKELAKKKLGENGAEGAGFMAGASDWLAKHAPPGRTMPWVAGLSVFGLVVLGFWYNGAHAAGTGILDASGTGIPDAVGTGSWLTDVPGFIGAVASVYKLRRVSAAVTELITSLSSWWVGLEMGGIRDGSTLTAILSAPGTEAEISLAQAKARNELATLTVEHEEPMPTRGRAHARGVVAALAFETFLVERAQNMAIRRNARNWVNVMVVGMWASFLVVSGTSLYLAFRSPRADPALLVSAEQEPSGGTATDRLRQGYLLEAIKFFMTGSATALLAPGIPRAWGPVAGVAVSYGIAGLLDQVLPTSVIAAIEAFLGYTVSSILTMGGLAVVGFALLFYGLPALVRWLGQPASATAAAVPREDVTETTVYKPVDTPARGPIRRRDSGGTLVPASRTVVRTQRAAPSPPAPTNWDTLKPHAARVAKGMLGYLIYMFIVLMTYR